MIAEAILSCRYDHISSQIREWFLILELLSFDCRCQRFLRFQFLRFFAIFALHDFFCFSIRWVARVPWSIFNLVISCEVIVMLSRDVQSLEQSTLLKTPHEDVIVGREVNVKRLELLLLRYCRLMVVRSLETKAPVESNYTADLEGLGRYQRFYHLQLLWYGANEREKL